MDDGVSRIRDFMRRNKINSDIIEFDVSTKNSQLAAQALNCPVAQIAKSIVFIVKEPVVIILSGDRRVSTAKLATVLGSTPSLADPQTVLHSTGFLVGGVPPFAHASKLRVLLDESLERFEEVYAAAGSPNAIFKIRLIDLKKFSESESVDVSI